jgi:hypothetical protein
MKKEQLRKITEASVLCLMKKLKYHDDVAAGPRFPKIGTECHAITKFPEENWA